jgi:hypothetical protein
MLEQHKRVRRQLIEWNMGTNKKVIKPSFRANGNNNNMYLLPDGADLDVKADGLKTVNTVLKDGSDLLGAPSRFLNNIQQHWIISLVLISIILVSLLLLFCIIRYYCCGKLKLPTKKEKIKKLAANMVSSSPLLCKNGTDKL